MALLSFPQDPRASTTEGLFIRKTEVFAGVYATTGTLLFIEMGNGIKRFRREGKIIIKKQYKQIWNVHVNLIQICTTRRSGKLRRPQPRRNFHLILRTGSWVSLYKDSRHWKAEHVCTSTGTRAKIVDSGIPIFWYGCFIIEGSYSYQWGTLKKWFSRLNQENVITKLAIHEKLFICFRLKNKTDF